MIIIGDSLVPYKKMDRINGVNDIQMTSNNGMVLFNYSIELLRYCQDNSVSCAVVVESLEEFIYASCYKPEYLICQSDYILDAQKIAEHYLFDSKVLMCIDTSSGLVWAAQHSIDGVIYEEVLTQ